MDYKNGKIYKLTSSLTEMIYIGATTQPLYKRHNEHKSILNKQKGKCTSIELIKLGDTKIELIENYPCDSKEQLNAREGYYIRLNKNICVNRCIMGRTKQEYYEANKEKIKDYKKLYNENNNDKIKQYYEVNKEIIKEKRKLNYQANKDKIAEQKKQYEEANKEKIAERKKQYYEANKKILSEKRKKYYQAKKANKLLNL